jgi:xanthine dehydrogenase iron-sulfur cluster and FAD-binding subunit A
MKAGSQIGRSLARLEGRDKVTGRAEYHPEPNDETIKHYLTGNLCRCAAYPEVLDAVRLASRKRRARISI